MCRSRRNVHASFAFISSTYTCYTHEHWLLHHPVTGLKLNDITGSKHLHFYSGYWYCPGYEIFCRSFLLSMYRCCFSIIKMENGPSPSHFPNEGSHSFCRLSTPIWDWWPDDGLRAASLDCWCLGFFRHRLWPDDGSVIASLSVCHPFLFTVFFCLKYPKVFSRFYALQACTMPTSPLSVHAFHSSMFITLTFYCSN